MYVVKNRLSALFERLEAEGPTDDIEVAWLDLSLAIERTKEPAKKRLMCAWHFFGYFFYDRKARFGLALHHRILQAELLANEKRPQFDEWFGVLIYAGFIADSKPAMMRALHFFAEQWTKIPAKEADRIIRLLIEYLRTRGQLAVPKSLEILIYKIFGRESSEIGEDYLRGEELAAILDPEEKLGPAPTFS